MSYAEGIDTQKGLEGLGKSVGGMGRLQHSPVEPRSTNFAAAMRLIIGVICVVHASMAMHANGRAPTTHLPLKAAAAGVVAQAEEDPRNIQLPVVEGHDIHFRHLSAARGFTQTRIAFIVQDDLGFIWFGTQYGLNRYDGYRSKVFRHEPGNSASLSGVFVRSLFKDREGFLWVGCDQFLDRYDPVSETFTHYEIKVPGQSAPGATVLQISQGKDGLLWLSTGAGLYSLDPSDGRIEGYFHDTNDTQSLRSNDIQSAREDREGTFWVATIDGLDAYDRAAKKVLLHIPIHAEEREFSFLEDSYGVFWIYHAGGGGGLAVYDRQTNKLIHYVFAPPAGNKIDATGFHIVLEDRDRALWLASNDSGLYKFDREHRRFIRYRTDLGDDESLSDDQLSTLYQDREGNIWVGLHQMAPNFFSYRPSAFEKYTKQSGGQNKLGASLVSLMYEDRKGILWISSSGSLNRIDPKTGTNRLIFSGVIEQEIHCMMEDKVGTLWAGTFRHGIQQIDEVTGAFKPHIDRLFALSNATGRPVTRMLEDKDGSIWATTWDGLRHFDLVHQRYTLYKPDMQNRAEYYDMARDRDGVFWLGSNAGLQRFDPATGAFKIYAHNVNDPKSLSDSQVDNIHFDDAGTMWVGTQNGLDEFDPEHGNFKVYRTENGMPGIVASCILNDRHSNLWMSTNNGISRFDPVTETFHNYSVDDGLSGPDLSAWGACYKSRSGKMFFGGFNGATAFYPDLVLQSAEVSKVVLTDFRLSGMPVRAGPHSALDRSISFARYLTLTHSQSIFSIEFSALNYLNAASNRYRYRLDGLDSGWHEVGSDQRQASYTTLPSGTYTFRVQTSSGGANWGEPGTSLQITVLPPWWSTWWFMTSYWALATLLLWIAYRFRLHQMAEQLQIRHQERIRERNRIARELHDTFLQGFQGLMLRFQAVLKTLPADSPAREMVENALDRADEVLLQGRERVQDLRTEGLAGNDLPSQLARCGEQLDEDNPMSFHFLIMGTPQELDSVVTTEAYRIAREAIINAFLHSNGSRIEVELTYDSRNVSLRVRDDGDGMEQNTLSTGRAGHWGLSGMRERAQKVGAQLRLWSDLGIGTEIELTIPARVAYAHRPRLWHRLISLVRGRSDQ